MLQPVIRPRLVGLPKPAKLASGDSRGTTCNGYHLPLDGGIAHCECCSSATSRASSAVSSRALALVFSLIITVAVVAVLLARVDNSAADLAAMLPDPGY